MLRVLPLGPTKSSVHEPTRISTDGARGAGREFKSPSFVHHWGFRQRYLECRCWKGPQRSFHLALSFTEGETGTQEVKAPARPEGHSASGPRPQGSACSPTRLIPEGAPRS